MSNAQKHDQEQLKLDQYYSLLREKYQIASEDISWRDLVGLYSRVWGKSTDNVKEPLNVVPKEKTQNCVDRLVKVFDKFSIIRAASNNWKARSDERKNFTAAQKTRFINKVNRTEHKKNLEKIEEQRTELTDIRTHLGK